MLLEFFDAYVLMGLKPIAIFKDSKRPVGYSWNKNWSKDKWRHYFEDGDYNIGLLLGDIIDVEGDSDEANELLDRMIGDVPHPMFRSNKSVHHLFLNPDSTLTRFVHRDIEFRGYLHQSVVPPSVHNEGIRYNFLRASRWPIPQLPPDLLRFYLENNKKRAAPKRHGQSLTETCCKICNTSKPIHPKRLALEVIAFREYNLPWMCHDCREFDLRDACRRIRRSRKAVSSRAGTQTTQQS